MGPPLDASQHRAGLESVRAALRRRGPQARCPTPVNEPPRANSGFRRGSVIYDGSATREMVHMLGEQSTSVSDRIQGEWETRQVYLAGRRLSLSESLALARHSAHGFGWGDGGSAAAQHALALLLRATDGGAALGHYQAFKLEGIARLPQAEFTLALSTVRDCLASRSAP